MKQGTTLFQISKILKISPSTVSRALKNHPDIAPDTRKKILELAERLDYEPNLYAVGLRTNNSKEFGVILPNLSGFFYDSFISALEEDARRMGYAVIILLSGDDPGIELENLKICKQRRVDGLFVCITPQTTDVSSFLKFQASETPVIFFDKVPMEEQINTVCVADEEAAILSANALLDAGKKKILSLFGNLNLSISRRRMDAYREAFRRKKEEKAISIQHAFDSEEARKIIHMAFTAEKERPDAIFCMSDEILIGTMKALQEIHLKVPNDVGVLAISNGFFPKLYHPEITYVETSGQKLGKMALSRMMEYLGGDKSFADRRVESVLVEGGSL